MALGELVGLFLLVIVAVLFVVGVFGAAVAIIVGIDLSFGSSV